MQKKQPPPSDLADLVAEKDRLAQQVEELKEEVRLLQMRRDIFEKAEEIVKKEGGINLILLTNREKAVLIDALRNKYRLKELLSELRMAKSSYFYWRLVFEKPDKYTDLRATVKDEFAQARGCYGYRRIHAVLRRNGTRVSEKVIRRIMREELLRASGRRKRRYSSYAGEISPAVANVIKRDFSAQAPNAKWLTDITEFNISAGRVYLSPIVDCFDGMAVAWTIGKSPNADLVNSMLDAATSLLEENEHPIIHTDRGAHYRWPG